jgi:hypothetical protein
MSKMKFELGERVAIAGGSEMGVIIGRAEYAHSENQYFVRYIAGDGRAAEAWWGESALEISALK